VILAQRVKHATKKGVRRSEAEGGRGGEIIFSDIPPSENQIRCLLLGHSINQRRKKVHGEPPK